MCVCASPHPAALAGTPAGAAIPLPELGGCAGGATPSPTSPAAGVEALVEGEDVRAWGPLASVPIVSPTYGMDVAYV